MELDFIISYKKSYDFAGLFISLRVFDRLKFSIQFVCETKDTLIN